MFYHLYGLTFRNNDNGGELEELEIYKNLDLKSFDNHLYIYNMIYKQRNIIFYQDNILIMIDLNNVFLYNHDLKRLFKKIKKKDLKKYKTMYEIIKNNNKNKNLINIFNKLNNEIKTKNIKKM